MYGTGCGAVAEGWVRCVAQGEGRRAMKSVAASVAVALGLREGPPLDTKEFGFT